MTPLTSLFSRLLIFTLLASGCTFDLDGLLALPDAGARPTNHPDANSPTIDSGGPAAISDADMQPPDTTTPVMSPDAEPPPPDTLITSPDADTWTPDTGVTIMTPDAGTKSDAQPPDLNPTSRPDSTLDREPSPDSRSYQPDSTPPPSDLQPSLKPLGSPCTIDCTYQPQMCECASGFCDLWSSKATTCSTKLPLGAKCNDSLVCESERCMMDKCVPECYPVCKDAG